ncbi:hypothetical protein SAMN04515621_0608 [Erythrobacter sp. HL-111]|nr:hypothetical protein SAMN04515621_0608 [Erythrobacter sp. HL-111]
MLPAVDFDGEAQGPAGEVGDEVSDGVLADEFDAKEVALAEVKPERAFRLRHFAAQFARGLRESLFRHRRTPIPNPFPQGKGLLALAAAFATPALAQSPATTPPPLAEWPGVEIASGVAFQGDGSVTVRQDETGLPVVAFWRPVLFREDTGRPVAGRMDCLVAATETPFAEADFDPDARHAAVAERRSAQGFEDRESLRDYGDDVRRLDIVGRQRQPLRYYVLSYILVRDGDRLVDVRRNCTFVHGKGVSGPDVLPYVDRYTRVVLGFDPGGGEG